MESKPSGDPNGTRIAKRRASAIAEASKVAELLEILLIRAGMPTRIAEGILATLKSAESTELQKAYGRLASRKSFPGRCGHPRLDNRKTIHLFIDESGKSHFEPSAQHEPVFALTGVAMTEESKNDYCQAADKVKLELFGTKDITFHDPSMRFHDGPYFFNGDRKKQEEFDEALDNLIRSTDFTVFAVGVRKRGFEDDFVKAGKDPHLPTDSYSLAISLLLERVVDFLAFSSTKMLGRLTFESQGPREDAEHQIHCATLLRDGTQWVSEKDFRNWLDCGCNFVTKAGSHPTELADILSRDVYEWVRSGCKIEPKHWAIFNNRVYCREDGLRGSFGLKIFPDEDIREEIIEPHRAACGAKLGKTECK